MKKLILLFIQSLFLAFPGFTQSILLSPSIYNSGGNSANHGIFNFEWSIGEETSIETLSKNNFIITTGVLQPESAIPNLDSHWGDEEIQIYPNPTFGIVHIHFLSTQKGKVSIILYDAIGRLMDEKQFEYLGTNSIENMDLTKYASGMYVLNIVLEPYVTFVHKKGAYKVIKCK